VSFDEKTMATHQQITRSSDVLDGKARLKGHRISVADIVEHLVAGESADEVASCLQITTEEVEAARDYWIDHPDEIDAQLGARDNLHDELVETSRAPSS
jgi:uncharacterized protein (DUF433 family)